MLPGEVFFRLSIAAAKASCAFTSNQLSTSSSKIPSRTSVGFSFTSSSRFHWISCVAFKSSESMSCSLCCSLYHVFHSWNARVKDFFHVDSWKIPITCCTCICQYGLQTSLFCWIRFPQEILSSCSSFFISQKILSCSC
ncbi:hypothetical protein [Crucivirus-483]|nr:hypothetical protein [Crucivirus-483]